MKRSMIMFLAALAVGGLAFYGCSSSEEAGTDASTSEQEFTATDSTADVLPDSDEPEPIPGDVTPIDRDIRPPKDTLGAAGGAAERETTAPARTGLMMWSVQIGAFKAESGALQLVNEAKKKFNQPVYKEYDPVSGFYKVNIGSFSKRDEASLFKTDVQAKGYPDAFTVEVRR